MASSTSVRFPGWPKSSVTSSSSRTNRYKQDIANREVVCDCIGGAKGYAWTGGGQAMLDAIGTDQSVPSTYGAHGCPDKGANSMFSYAKSKGCAWGTMATLPEVPGLALTKDGHVGYYIGNGWAVEWQGFAYGCVDGAFVEEHTGRQVIFLNGGASECRQGKLGLVNRGILRWALKEEMPSWT